MAQSVGRIERFAPEVEIVSDQQAQEVCEQTTALSATEFTLTSNVVQLPSSKEPIGVASLRDRIKQAKTTIQDSLYSLAGRTHARTIQAFEGFYQDREKGEQRRKITARVLGGVALMGMSYVVARGFLSTLLPEHTIEATTLMGNNQGHAAHSFANTAANIKPPSATPELDVPSVFPAKTGNVHAIHEHAQMLHQPVGRHIAHAVHKQALVAELPTYNARTGAGTVDHLVLNQAHELGYHINEADPRLHTLVSETLHRNGISWQTAYHLPVGFHVHMLHPEQIEELLKKN